MASTDAVTTTSGAPSRRFKLVPPAVQDVVSGLVTGLFSIPEGMAYANLGGFNPLLGLYAGIVPTMVGSLTASTALMISTLTSAIALSSQSALQQAGLDPSNLGNVFALTFMVGIIMLLFGLLRLGVLMNFVSTAVMTGFVTGIAVQILTGEFYDFSGYKPTGDNKIAQIVNWLLNIGQWVPITVLISIATIGVWLIFDRIKRTENLATILAMVVMTVVVTLLQVPVELVSSIGTITRSLPLPMLPDFSVMPSLFLGALSVALVALAQAASIGVAVPNPDGKPSNVSKDFTAQGIANIAGGFFQALPVGGSLSRTGVATGAGAKSRWAGIFAGLWLALVIVLIGPLAELIPLPVIAGLMFVVAGEIIVGKVPEIRLILTTSVDGAIAMVATFLATMFIPLQWAILLGALLSLLVYAIRASRQARVVRLVRAADGGWLEEKRLPALQSNTINLYEYYGTGLFAELQRLHEIIPPPDSAKNAVLILRLRGAPEPSLDLAKAMRRYHQKLRANGNLLMLVAVDPPFMRVLEHVGLADEIGRDNIFPPQEEVFGALKAAVAKADAWLQSNQAAASSSASAPEVGPDSSSGKGAS